eukprot:m.14474 g.14474  ORF g.14474 m.14474 type:complete len:453 (-) comp4319_c0_seq1:170-1528(-)
MPSEETALSNEDRAYIGEHGLDNLFQAMMRALLRSKPSNPIKFLVQKLDKRSSSATKTRRKQPYGDNGPLRSQVQPQTAYDTEVGLPQPAKDSVGSISMEDSALEMEFSLEDESPTLSLKDHQRRDTLREEKNGLVTMNKHASSHTQSTPESIFPQSGAAGKEQLRARVMDSLQEGEWENPGRYESDTIFSKYGNKKKEITLDTSVESYEKDLSSSTGEFCARCKRLLHPKKKSSRQENSIWQSKSSGVDDEFDMPINTNNDIGSLPTSKLNGPDDSDSDSGSVNSSNDTIGGDGEEFGQAPSNSKGAVDDGADVGSLLATKHYRGGMLATKRLTGQEIMGEEGNEDDEDDFVADSVVGMKLDHTLSRLNKSYRNTDVSSWKTTPSSRGRISQRNSNSSILSSTLRVDPRYATTIANNDLSDEEDIYEEDMMSVATGVDIDDELDNFFRTGN